MSSIWVFLYQPRETPRLFYENAAQEHGSVIDSMAALNKLAVQTRSWGKIPEEHTQCSSILKHCRAPFARQTHDGLITAILICSLIPVLEGPLLNYAGLLLGKACPWRRQNWISLKKIFSRSNFSPFSQKTLQIISVIREVSVVTALHCLTHAAQNLNLTKWKTRSWFPKLYMT